MEIIKTNCVNCGSPIYVDLSKGRAVCQYCNTPFVYESKISNVNVANLFEIAKNAENAENFVEALNNYNKIIQVQPNNVHALICKAFCSLAVFTYGKLNFKEFEFYFNKAVELNGDENVLQFHTLILDKIWTMLNYASTISARILTEKYSTNRFVANDYIENIIALHNVQRTISNVVDNTTLSEISNVYKECYLEFKTATIANAEQIFNMAKRFGVSIDKQVVKQIKEHVKQAEKQLKNFKKIYC